MEGPRKLKKPLKAEIWAICLMLWSLGILYGQDFGRLGEKIERTPYDAYFGEVKKVREELKKKTSKKLPEIHFDQVKKWQATCYRWEYVHQAAYHAQSPEATEESRSGDCKDKSLWLWWKLQNPDARLVVGKLNIHQPILHAWVIWPHDGKWYVLDPAFYDRPQAVEDILSIEYIPYYSFDVNGKYKHQENAP